MLSKQAVLDYGPFEVRWKQSNGRHKDMRQGDEDMKLGGKVAPITGGGTGIQSPDFIPKPAPFQII